MEQMYEVYPDKFKEAISLLIYTLFIAGLIGILFFYKPNIFIMLLITVFVFLIGAMALQILKKIKNNERLYVFNETGITDYTRKEHIIHLTWEEIGKIEVLSNNASLQIGIVGTKVFEEKDAVSANVRENLVKNGNMIFYNIIIDGFLYRKKQFNQIFKTLQQMAGTYNTNIIVNEYVDPLERKKRMAR